MHKPKSVLENETGKILWSFQLQIIHPIPKRRPDLELIKKKEDIVATRILLLLAD